MKLPSFEFDDDGHQDYPNYEFSKLHTVQRKPLKVGRISVKLDSDQHKQLIESWLKECADVVQGMPHDSVCVLYAYTTTTFHAVQGRLRSPKTQNLRVDLGCHPVTHQDALFNVATESNINDIVKNTYEDSSRLKEALEAWRTRPRGNNGDDEDEATYEERQALFETLYKTLEDQLKRVPKEAFTAKFLRSVDQYQKTSTLHGPAGWIFAPQIWRRFGDRTKKRPTLAKLRDLIANHMTTEARWRAVLDDYIRDLDAIFDQMPPLPADLVVYRGVHGKKYAAGKSIRDAGYVSTSVRRDIAQGFASKKKKCCLQQIKVPAGTRVVPLIFVSRYYAEQEILLPRNTSFKAERIEM